MENRKQGYRVKEYKEPVKRYCQTLDLKDNPELIEQYKKYHSEDHVWPEIPVGIQEAGILEMEIYLLGTRLFMIVETPLSFEWDTAMAKLSTMPMQQQWEDLTSTFQVALPGSSSTEKWQLMERIFYIYT